MDCKKCDRPAVVKGYCRGHYNSRRTKAVRAGLWKPTVPAIGITRRVRALVAIGYSQNDLCRCSGLSPSTMSHLIRGNMTRTHVEMADAVRKMYDELSMTPGTCEKSKHRARKNRWVPPLAWDDDLIEIPDAQPDRGQQRTVRWDEKYYELRDTLGLTQEQIANRLGINRESLLRQLDRYGISCSTK